MINRSILVGRLLATREVEGGTNLTIAVPRSEKNKEGIYITDFIDCLLPSTHSKALEYIVKGDMVGINGSLETGMILRVDKISFIRGKN